MTDEQFSWIKTSRLMDTMELARKARGLRAEQGLTQEELAARIISERTGKPISKQMISRAENEEVGTEANNLRIQIIEMLTGKSLNGPVWFFTEDVPPAA